MDKLFSDNLTKVLNAMYIYSEYSIVFYFAKVDSSINFLLYILFL